MIVGTCRIELHVAASTSLKEKRRVIKSLCGKIGHRFNVSVSEIDYHDLRQRGAIAVAHVGPTRTDTEKVLNSVVLFAQSAGGDDVVRCVTSYFNPETDFENPAY